MTFLRAFPTELSQTAPRLLTGRLVPYGETAWVVDTLADGQRDIYQEGFRPEAFARQANTTERGVLTRIGLVHSHEGGLGYLGPVVALREQSDGLYGDVSILRSRATDITDLLDQGIRELSIEFHLPQPDHTEVDGDGVRWRSRAHLHQVALEAKGAYSSAEVLALRAAVDEADRERSEADLATQQVAQRAEAEAAERRRRWEQLTGRATDEAARQDELVRRYGMIRPERYGQVSR